MNPSSEFLSLAEASNETLEETLLRGEPPELDEIVDWEYRGTNTIAVARLAGIKKFAKGFFRKGNGSVFGYNIPVKQNPLSDDWQLKPSADKPKRFGFYSVAPVDPRAKDNTYLRSVLLDYSKGNNPLLDPSRRLRDYLVRVTPGSDDLLLGKAYAKVGPTRLPLSFFVLERMRKRPDEL